MAQAQNRKEQPLSMRLNEADIAVIDRAARLRGRSRTEFVRDAAVRAAEAVLMEVGPLRMSEAGFDAFVSALEAPGQVVEAMVERLRRPAPWGTDKTEAY